VCESSVEVVLGYFNKWTRDGKGRIIKVDNFTEVTTQIAYMVFTAAGTLIECASQLSLTTLLVFVRLWYERGLIRDRLPLAPMCSGYGPLGKRR